MVTDVRKFGHAIAAMPASEPLPDEFQPDEAASEKPWRDVVVTVEPFDGWGFMESLDGKLASVFEVGEVESGVFVQSGIRGWRGRVATQTHKYQNMVVTMTPRHRENSPTVVLSVRDGEKLIFSGMADTTGLQRNW